MPGFLKKTAYSAFTRPGPGLFEGKKYRQSCALGLPVMVFFSRFNRVKARFALHWDKRTGKHLRRGSGFHTK